MKKFILVVFLTLTLALAACGSDTGTSGSPSATQAPTATPTATAKPTQPPKWTTIQHFSGTGSKKTQIFAVPDDYKILYTCAGGTYGSYLSATIYDNHNAYVDGAVNVMCDAGKTTKGETEEHQAGSIYLDIMGTDAWTITVQILK